MRLLWEEQGFTRLLPVRTLPAKVIARRERIGLCDSRFVNQWIATPARGLRYREILRYSTTVSLRGGSVSEGRGNPSCLEGRVQGMRFGS